MWFPWLIFILWYKCILHANSRITVFGNNVELWGYLCVTCDVIPLFVIPMDCQTFHQFNLYLWHAMFTLYCCQLVLRCKFTETKLLCCFFLGPPLKWTVNSSWFLFVIVQSLCSNDGRKKHVNFSWKSSFGDGLLTSINEHKKKLSHMQNFPLSNIFIEQFKSCYRLHFNCSVGNIILLYK